MKIRINTIQEANLFSNICDKFEEDIDVSVGRYVIDGKSYLGLLSIGLPHEMNVEFHGKKEQKNRFKEMIIKWIVED